MLSFGFSQAAQTAPEKLSFATSPLQASGSFGSSSLWLLSGFLPRRIHGLNHFRRNSRKLLPAAAFHLAEIVLNSVRNQTSFISKLLPLRYESKPEALRDAGIAYAVEQIVDLIANGVDGIHLYTMNSPYVAEKITRAVENLL